MKFVGLNPDNRRLVFSNAIGPKTYHFELPGRVVEAVGHVAFPVKVADGPMPSLDREGVTVATMTKPFLELKDRRFPDKGQQFLLKGCAHSMAPLHGRDGIVITHLLLDDGTKMDMAELLPISDHMVYPIAA